MRDKYKRKKYIVAAFKGFVILVISFIILLPLYWIFISSITPSDRLFNSPIDYFPDHVTLDNYIYLFKYLGLAAKVGSTMVIVGFTLVINTAICVLAAYAFTRFRSRGISLAFGFILASMLLPDVVFARPLYVFMQKTGLYDTYPGLIILYISGEIPFTILVLRNFVGEIPYELEEAAAIDGANFIQRVSYVVMPLMKPAVATVCIINFIGCLNNFFTPMFFSNHIQTLAVAIVQLPLRDNMYSVPWDLTSATGWLILFPIIIFVAIFEKRIMEGIMAGGVKA